MLERTAAAIKDPLFRFFERELKISSRLLETVQTDLKAIEAVCTGARKMTNALKRLIDQLVVGVVPKDWSSKYKIPDTLTISAWLPDFVARLAQFSAVAEHA